MPPSTQRILIAVVLIAHGIGHGLGVLPSPRVQLTKTHSARSWLFSRLFGDTGARVVGGAVWLLALVAFVAIGGAALSLAGCCSGTRFLLPSPTAWPSLS